MRAIKALHFTSFVALLALLLLVTGCGGTSAPPATATLAPTETATALPPTPAPTATPKPEDLGEGSIELIRRGWTSIADLHISDPNARSLLLAAWQAVGVEARRQGVTPGTLPALTDDRVQAWDAFSAAYIGLLHATPPAGWDALRFAALDGMTKSLNDCHTFFLPPQTAAVLTDVRTGRGSGGIGVELAAVKPTYVREAIADGPAQKAGVLAGDYLLSVDGQDVTGMGVEAVTEMLRGNPGSSVAIQVRRPSTGAVLSFPLTRALVQTPPASGQVLDGGIGVIRMRSFTTNGTLLKALDQVVAGFEAQGVTAWVLDLRDNPGGDSDLDLDGRFIGDQVAERLTLRDGGLEVNNGNGQPYPEHPVAVLVNSGTASVGEIFSSMLQDYGRGRVFGTQTSKCAGFVDLMSYPDGSTLAVTIAHALTPKTEKPLWQTGVIPDQTVRQTQDDLAANRDPVLDAAVAWLKTQAR